MLEEGFAFRQDDLVRPNFWSWTGRGSSHAEVHRFRSFEVFSHRSWGVKPVPHRVPLTLTSPVKTDQSELK